MELSGEAKLSIGVSLVVAVFAAGSAPWWWHYVHPSAPPPSTVASVTVGMSGGCESFQLFAQNRWETLGTAIREQPNVLSTQVGSFPGNMSISVNGWVHGRPAYTTNTPPWNNDVWYHLTDGAGWVSFPGVRATPVLPDPSGVADGGPPAPISDVCQGAVQ